MGARLRAAGMGPAPSSYPSPALPNELPRMSLGVNPEIPGWLRSLHGTQWADMTRIKGPEPPGLSSPGRLPTREPPDQERGRRLHPKAAPLLIWGAGIQLGLEVALARQHWPTSALSPHHPPDWNTQSASPSSPSCRASPRHAGQDLCDARGWGPATVGGPQSSQEHRRGPAPAHTGHGRACLAKASPSRLLPPRLSRDTEEKRAWTKGYAPPSLCTHAFKLLADFPGGRRGRGTGGSPSWAPGATLSFSALLLLTWSHLDNGAGEPIQSLHPRLWGTCRGPPSTLSWVNVVRLSLGT